MTTSARLLELLSLLQGRRDWPGDELASRLGVSCRTIRRDVERLRELGYPVESLPGPSGGYRLAAGTAMPPLLLDDDEAIAIAVGLRTAAGVGVSGIEETSVRALVKLEQVLPAHLRRRVHALQSVLATMPATGPVVDPEALAAIAAACRDHDRLRFGYTTRDGTEAPRDVEPHGLVHLHGRWYLVAFDPSRTAWRTFRVDRLRDPAPSGHRFRPRKVPGGDLSAYVARSVGGASYRHEAVVRLPCTSAALRARHEHLWGDLRDVGPDGCELRTSDDHLGWLALRLAMLGEDFELVDGSPELVGELRALRDRLHRAVAGAWTAGGRCDHRAT